MKDLNGALAELWIAVNETKVIQQDERHSERLARASALVDQWENVFRLREDYERAARTVAGGA